MKLLFLSTFLFLTGLVGCIGPVQIAPLPYAHPANAEAPAGVLPPLATELDIAENPGVGAKHKMSGNQGSAPGEIQPTGKYQCTMHSEVRSDKPGRCSVCGMKLVEKAEKDAQHRGTK